MKGDFCCGLNNEGKPCRAMAKKDGTLCYWHDPRFADKIVQERSKGLEQIKVYFKNKKLQPAPYKLDSVEDVHATMARVVNDMRLGNLSPTVGTAIVGACRVILQAKSGTDGEETRKTMAELKDHIEKEKIRLMQRR